MAQQDTTAAPPPEAEAEEGDFGLDQATVPAILAAVEAGDAGQLRELMAPLHAADIADLLEQIPSDQREGLLRLYGPEFDGEILSELDEALREEIIAHLAPEVFSEAVRDLDTDDVVDLIEGLEDDSRQQEVLEALDRADRVAVEQALTWPEHSAGRLMQRELVMAPQHWTVGEAIDYLRSAEELPDQFYHMILVTPRLEPLANVTLGRILSSRRDVKLADIVEETFRPFHVEDREADVAFAFNQYHLISSPVVDDLGRLVGMITIDDAMAVLDEEHEEDMLRLASVSEESHVSDNAFETARQRVPWLVVNLFTASLSALVISFFEDMIATLVTLAILMPIVASTGGIAGTQSLAVAVRGLATRSLTAANARRVIGREFWAGMMNGLVLAAILALAAWLIFHDAWLGAVLAAAMITNQMVAALGGVLVPLGLNRLGLDPALASGTFVTTLTDVMGYFAFLGFAAMFLL